MKFTLALSMVFLTAVPLLSQNLPEFSFDGYTDQLNNIVVTEYFVGGLSGITYDPDTGRYLAITDNSTTVNNNSGKASIYSFNIIHDPDGEIIIEDIQILSLKNRLAGINPESLRVINGGFIISDEGTYHSEIMKISADGTYLEEIYKTTEIQYNSGFEGTCITDDQNTLFFSMERPIDNNVVRGGAEENLGAISVFQYDFEQKEIIGQYLYPLHVPPAGDNFTDSQFENFNKDNGVTEILAYNDTTLLFLERAFLGGSEKKLHIRLYMASITEETNILTGNFNLLQPTKVFDFYQSDIPFDADNIEGMTFDAEKGRLYLISDDNFDHYGEQITQVISLKIN